MPIDETHPQAPVNPYGESKLMVEQILRWYGSAYGLKWVALRYFNAAGADPDGEIGEDHDPETHLIPLVIGAALGTRPPVKVFGTDYPTPDGSAVRDYVHVMDLADAHRRALEGLGNGTASQAINLGTGQGHSVRSVIETVNRVGGKKVPFEEAPRRAGDPPELVAAPGPRAGRARMVLPLRRRSKPSSSMPGNGMPVAVTAFASPAAGCRWCGLPLPDRDAVAIQPVAPHHEQPLPLADHAMADALGGGGPNTLAR